VTFGKIVGVSGNRQAQLQQRSRGAPSIQQDKFGLQVRGEVNVIPESVVDSVVVRYTQVRNFPL
jgi:hypothetical protein